MDPKQHQAVSAAPASQQSLFKRVYEGKAGRAAAMKAMCLQCVGHARKDVQECADTTCPLWRLRPYQSGKAELEGGDS